MSKNLKARLRFCHFGCPPDNFQGVVKALFYIHFKISAIPVAEFPVFGAFAIIEIIEQITARLRYRFFHVFAVVFVAVNFCVVQCDVPLVNIVESFRRQKPFDFKVSFKRLVEFSDQGSNLAQISSLFAITGFMAAAYSWQSHLLKSLSKLSVMRLP